MKLEALIRELPVKPEGESDLGVEVAGIQHDSRRVEPGDLFVAIVGQRHDGRAFVAEALERGAVAVVAPGPPPVGFPGPWLTTPEPRRLLAPLAGRIFAHPDREMRVVGVTGTNGKSTVVALVGAVLEEAGQPTALLGTLGYRFHGRLYEGERTTPEASDLYRILRCVRQQGAEAVAMEISSHALQQERVSGIGLDVAVFTNLTRDHLDFHGDFESYFQAKSRLFAQLKPGGRAVVNLSDAYGRRLAVRYANAITFGDEGRVRAVDVELDADGIRGAIETPSGTLRFVSPLLGRYNVANLIAAAAVAEALRVPHAAVARAFGRVRPLPGRMEPVDRGQPFPVFVDYAHTDAALEAALRAVREFTRRRVILVFGCGGDRDPGKRVLMGRVAGELAALPIITSDNPRREDPQAIILAVEEGLKQSRNPDYRVVPDRREAIRKAIALAGKEHAVLVAGKGHERVQILADRQIPFCDREEIERVLEERFGAATPR